jgi:hypothetical protein
LDLFSNHFWKDLEERGNCSKHPDDRADKYQDHTKDCSHKGCRCRGEKESNSCQEHADTYEYPSNEPPYDRESYDSGCAFERTTPADHVITTSHSGMTFYTFGFLTLLSTDITSL